MTHEEVLEQDAQHVADYGYMLQAVGDGPDDPNAWAYSIGLTDVAGHPEMIVTGRLYRGAALLRYAAEAVIDGDDFFVGDVIESPIGSARIEPVHVVHYDLDTFNNWHWLKEYGAIHAPELIALEIVMPGHAGPTLADSRSRLGTQLNRATRRPRNRDLRRSR